MRQDSIILKISKFTEKGNYILDLINSDSFVRTRLNICRNKDYQEFMEDFSESWFRGVFLQMKEQRVSKFILQEASKVMYDVIDAIDQRNEDIRLYDDPKGNYNDLQDFLKYKYNDYYYNKKNYALKEIESDSMFSSFMRRNLEEIKDWNSKDYLLGNPYKNLKDYCNSFFDLFIIYFPATLKDDFVHISMKRVKLIRDFSVVNEKLFENVSVETLYACLNLDNDTDTKLKINSLMMVKTYQLIRIIQDCIPDEKWDLDFCKQLGLKHSTYTSKNSILQKDMEEEYSIKLKTLREDLKNTK